ncbi:MAG TPA: glutathione S-transferase family protein [Roseateles sp.]|uniref:glutathione S-transferase family protein n=1 Tax=Roseateles sp. TaxID=1971397 RepID=UPI002ED8E30A
MPVATPPKPAARRRAKAAPARQPKATPAPAATLTLSSKNYSSWSLRGWLLARFAGLDFEELMLPPDDEDARRELLLLAPSIRVPCLRHEGVTVWNTLAIAEYLAESFPNAGLWPADRVARAHARAVCGEMNSGFANLRASLPMNLKGHFPRHRIWAGARPDIERIEEIWTECLARYGGPYLFGARRGAADAIFAPVVTRFLTYDVPLNPACLAYCQTIAAMPELQAWAADARLEPDEIEQLDMDF